MGSARGVAGANVHSDADLNNSNATAAKLYKLNDDTEDILKGNKTSSTSNPGSRAGPSGVGMLIKKYVDKETK